MVIILNDLPFNYYFNNIYSLKKAVQILCQVFKEFHTMNLDVCLQFKCSLSNILLMSDFPISRLYNSSEIPKDEKRMILSLFSKIKIININNEEDYFIYDNRKSKLCSYAIKNNFPVISILSNSCFEFCLLKGNNLNNDKKVLINISKKDHITKHAEYLHIRKYEFNPKHKIGYGWGSPMDLDDATAQKVLNEAQIFQDNDKCLVNKYNNNFYVFRRHYGICYHGYINNKIPDNIKNRF